MSGFLIIISPPKEVETVVVDLKSEFRRKYGTYDAMYSRPHISICNFRLLEERGKDVFATFQSELAGLEPFLLQLDGFGCFRGSNVIHINVANSAELNKLRETFYRLSVKLWLRNSFILFETPHLTIAKKMQAGIFESARTAYLPRLYRHSFTVDKLKVLRYDFESKRYDVYQHLRFGLPQT